MNEKRSKNLEVVPYNADWPEIFKKQEKIITSALQDNCIELYHIGSTSVPTLQAKPIIDMIMVIKNPDLCITQLEAVGYTYKGELNIPFRLYFTQDGEPKVHLHVFEPGNPEIDLNLLFRDYLRNNTEARKEYAALKTKLLDMEGAAEKKQQGLMAYTLAKDAFIRNLLKETGFNKLRLLFCAHKLEWEAYHRIRDVELFEPLHVVYDRNHLSITASNCYHFVLCLGTTVVSVAMLEFLNDGIVALRTVATDRSYQGKGYAKHMLALLEKWAKRHGGKIIKTHANLKAETFYRKQGYVHVFFDDASIVTNGVDLGKVL